MKTVVRRVGYVLLLALPPLLAALWAGATTIPGGSFEPWAPAMIDLDVYRRTGDLVLHGQDFYNVEAWLPWIYPPFPALLAVPFAAVPVAVAQVAWLALNTACLLAMLYRLGLVGWRLSLAATAIIWLVEPVRETLGFGQVAVFLVTAAVLDSMPGPTVFRRRLLPEGWLTGVATAVKLTPAVVAVYNFFSGKQRAGVVSFLSFLACTAIGFVVLWGPSLTYWGRLLSGDSGLNTGIVFKTNQSVLGVWTRQLGEASRGGLILAALVVLLGVAAAVLMHRAGEVPLALCLAGLTSLLASPISWSHHYVWIVPFGIELLRNRRLPAYITVPGLLYSVWTAFAPFKLLPGDNNVELSYPPLHMLIDNIGVYVGVGILAACVVAAFTPWGRDRRRAQAQLRVADTVPV
ncbi:MAG: glycosyltransferase 87 family protein [Micropruina sp.]|uniref:glycosyltransferase 87 family protein n=1 Tax=Micropruina sp. TaxID=2737536 RepID=UPI0039E2663D